MMKFRKKPIVIDAFIWTGGPDQTEDPEWIVEALCDKRARILAKGTGGVVLMIQTDEGEMRAQPGDWIIKGIEGELYPCKPDIFEATYEKVEA